jgi:hypothetical protein
MCSTQALYIKKLKGHFERKSFGLGLHRFAREAAHTVTIVVGVGLQAWGCSLCATQSVTVRTSVVIEKGSIPRQWKLSVPNLVVLHPGSHFTQCTQTIVMLGCCKGGGTLLGGHMCLLVPSILGTRIPRSCLNLEQLKLVITLLKPHVTKMQKGS